MGNARSAEAPHRMKFWFQRKKLETATEPPRPTCHGCHSNDTEMVVPVSPEVLSYRCTQCGRQWSVRAHDKKPPDQTL
jgi:transposase-like protein